MRTAEPALRNPFWGALIQWCGGTDAESAAIANKRSDATYRLQLLVQADDRQRPRQQSCRGPCMARLNSNLLARSDRDGASLDVDWSMNYVKSKQRVADHGEVFTPPWLVEAMLDLVKGETERIDSRFLEPACGSGNFLVRILQRKLAAVELKFGKFDFEKRHYALLALMCTYGIELLADNIAECRANMLEIFADYLKIGESDDFYRAASYVLSQNIVHGDALKMRTTDDQPITFAEWDYLGRGKFQRRDFRLDVLTGSSTFSAEGSLFAHLGKHEIFMPIKTYPPMTVRELAAGFGRTAPVPSSVEQA